MSVFVKNELDQKVSHFLNMVKFPHTRQFLLAKMNGIIEKNIVLKENRQTTKITDTY